MRAEAESQHNLVIGLALKFINKKYFKFLDFKKSCQITMSCAKLLLSEKSELVVDPITKSWKYFHFFLLMIWYLNLIPGPSVDTKLLWTVSKLFGQNQKLIHIN